MSGDEIRRSVREAIAEALGVHPAQLPSPATADTVERWDSLGHFQIMELLSRRFAVEIDHQEAMRLVAEEGIVGFIRDRRGNSGGG